MTRWIWPCLIVGSVLVLGVGFADAATPATISACVHRVNHNVRIVSDPAECRSFENPVSWQAGSPAAPAGSGGLSVVDAKGRKVGETIQLAGNSATVVLTLQGVMVPLEVSPQGFRPSGSLFFVGTTDCSGPPWMAPPRSVYFPPLVDSVVGPPGLTLYIAASGGESPPLSRTGSYTWASSDGSFRCSQFTFSATESLFPAQSVGDLNALFTLPFRVQ